MVCNICTMQHMHKLSEYLKATGETQQQLADRLGVHRSHLSKLMRGVAYPSRDLMAAIARETGGQVPISAWFPEAAE